MTTGERKEILVNKIKRQLESKYVSILLLEKIYAMLNNV